MALDSTGRLTPEQALAFCRSQGMSTGMAGNMVDSPVYPAVSGGMVPPMGYPAVGFPPILQLPGCQVNVNTCAFPSLETDLRLFSWPQIDQEMWDNFTVLDVIVSGALPLTAGGSITFQQEARRNLTWIPDCIQISTTWSSDPQPGLLSYQWAVAPKNTTFPTGQVQFGNTYNGQQYEPNQNQTYKVPFPDYKGVDTQVIGALSALQLVVSLSPVATSDLEAILITAYHKSGADYRKSCSFERQGSGCGCGK